MGSTVVVVLAAGLVPVLAAIAYGLWLARREDDAALRRALAPGCPVCGHSSAWRAEREECGQCGFEARWERDPELQPLLDRWKSVWRGIREIEVGRRAETFGDAAHAYESALRHVSPLMQDDPELREAPAVPTPPPIGPSMGSDVDHELSWLESKLRARVRPMTEELRRAAAAGHGRPRR